MFLNQEQSGVQAISRGLKRECPIEDLQGRLRSKSSWPELQLAETALVEFTLTDHASFTGIDDADFHEWPTRYASQVAADRNQKELPFRASEARLHPVLNSCLEARPRRGRSQEADYLLFTKTKAPA